MEFGGLAFPDSGGPVYVDENGDPFVANSLVSVEAAIAQTIVHSTWTPIVMGTENYDVNSEFVSDTFTAKEAGKYSFDGTVTFPNPEVTANTLLQIALDFEGTRFFKRGSFAGGMGSEFASIATHGEFDLAVGEEVKLVIRHTEGVDADLFAGGWTYLNVHRIG